jgi:hypothetical protein
MLSIFLLVWQIEQMMTQQGVDRGIPLTQIIMDQHPGGRLQVLKN